MTETKETQMINEHSTDEQILDAMREDGYLNEAGGFNFIDGIGDVESVCNWIRLASKRGALLWTPQHIVSTLGEHKFELTPRGE